MKICFICNEYPPYPHGGVGTCIKLLAEGLKEKGHTVFSVGIYRNIEKSLVHEVVNGVEVYRIRSKRKIPLGWVINRIQLFLLCRKLVKKQGVEIIETPVDNGFIAFFPKLKAPYIVRAQKTYSWHISDKKGPPPKKTAMWLEKKSLQNAFSWIAVSSFTAKITQKLHKIPPPYKVIYNAVENNTSNIKVNKQQGTFLFAGTLTKKKGVIELVKAFNNICETRNDISLELYGKDNPYKGGSMKNYLESIITSKARNHISFKGHVKREEMLDRMKTVAGAVFPSYGEAFGFVAAEAMACGCPVIYTKLPCGPELIDDGSEGLLVEPTSPLSIKEAVIYIADHPEEAINFARKAHYKVNIKFSFDKWVKDNEDYYMHIIQLYKK